MIPSSYFVVDTVLYPDLGKSNCIGIFVEIGIGPSLRAREQRVSQHESVVASRADAEPSRRRTTKKRSSSEHSSVLEARIGSPLPKRVHSVTHRDSSPGTSSSLLSSPSASIQQGLSPSPSLSVCLCVCVSSFLTETVVLIPS